MEQRVKEISQYLKNYFYSSSDNAAVNLAARQLCSTSQSQDFIDASLNILFYCQEYKFSMQMVTMLSIMLKDKFKFGYELINKSKQESYYSQLIQITKKMGTSHRILYINISEILAIMYLNHVSNKNINLETYLQNIKKTQTLQYNQYYFRVLQFCAADIKSYKLVWDEATRKNTKHKLVQMQLYVLHQLDEVSKQTFNITTFDKKAMIQCFQSWIGIKYNNEIYRKLPNSYIFEMIMHKCFQQNYSLVSTNCLRTVIDNISQHGIEKNQQIFTSLSNFVKGCLPLSRECWQKGQIIVAEELMRFIIYFSSEFCQIILQNYSPYVRQNYLQPIFQFHRFKEKYVVNDLQTFCSQLMNKINESRLSGSAIHPHFQQQLPILILEITIEMCKYTPAYMNELNGICEMKLNNRHQAAQDTWNYRCNALQYFGLIAECMGNQNYVHYIINILNQLNFLDPIRKAIQFEAYFLAMSYPISKLNIISNELRALVTFCMKILADQNQTNSPILLKRTVLKVFRRVFQIKYKQKNLIQELMTCVIECFNVQLLIDDAGKAFRTCCIHNKEIFYDQIEILEGIVKNYYEQMSIISGYIYLCCFNQQYGEMYIFMMLKYLHQLFFKGNLDMRTRKRILRSFTSIFDVFKQFQLGYLVNLVKTYFTQAWDDFVAVIRGSGIKKYQRYEDLDQEIQMLIKMLKCIMRTLKSEFFPCLKPIFDKVNQVFKTTPICSYAYLLEVAISTLSQFQGSSSYLKTIYEDFSLIIMGFLSTAASIERNQNLFDDFAGMNLRVLQFNINLITDIKGFQIFKAFLNLVCQDGLNTNIDKVFKSSCSYLQTLYMLYWNQQIREEYIQAKEQAISIGCLQDNLFYQIRDILLNLSINIVKNLFNNLIDLTNKSKTQIIDTLTAEIRAFPLENIFIWKDIVEKIPSDILVMVEKIEMYHYFQNLQENCSLNQPLMPTIYKIDQKLKLIVKRIKLLANRTQMKHLSK